MCLPGPACEKAIVTSYGYIAVAFLGYGIFAYVAFTSCVAPASNRA